MKKFVMLCIYFFINQRAFKYIKNNYLSGILSLFAIDFVPTFTLEPDTVEIIPTLTCVFYVSLLFRCLSCLPHHGLGSLSH